MRLVQEFANRVTTPFLLPLQCWSLLRGQENGYQRILHDTAPLILMMGFLRGLKVLVVYKTPSLNYLIISFVVFGVLTYAIYCLAARAITVMAEILRVPSSFDKAAEVVCIAAIPAFFGFSLELYLLPEFSLITKAIAPLLKIYSLILFYLAADKVLHFTFEGRVKFLIGIVLCGALLHGFLVLFV